MKDKKQVLSQESESAFKEGIALVLSQWDTLKLALDEGFGGKNSRRIADQFTSDIFFWFTLSTEPLDVYGLEDKLHECLLSLRTVTEDDDVEKRAVELMSMYEECLEGNFEYIEAQRESGRRRVPISYVRQDDMDKGFGCSLKMIVESSKDVSNSNSEDMLVDEPIMPKPSGGAEAEWKVVGPKRRRGKRSRF